MNKENSNIEHGNEPTKDLPLAEEIISDNQPASKDEILTQRMPEIKINKTAWDKRVEALHVLSSIAMVIVTVFLVKFAYKQWDVATKQADAAKKQADAANEQIKVAQAQNELVSKQANAAEKQADAVNEQIKVAQAQNELMRRMNEEAKTSNLNMNPVVGAYYVGGSDDVNGKIDLVFRNLSSRPTAILSIYLRTKEGSYFRTIGEPDGIKLPLNIGAWSAEKISFSLKKNDIKQMEDIVVTDMDDRQTPIKPTQWSANVQLSGIAMKAEGGQVTASSTSNPVKVCKNQTVKNSGIVLFVRTITFDENSGRFVVYVTISAPGKKDKDFSSDKINSCWSYDEYAIRLHAISTDCAEFIISQREKACE